MKFSIVVILLFFSSLLSAQIREIDRKTVDADMFMLDKLGSFYFINENVLNKQDKDFKTLYTYDDNSFGNISMADVSDPLRILVYYRDFNSLVYLDKNLADLRDPVLLDDLGFYSVDVVAASQQGGFWLYDNQNSRVVELDNNLNIVQEGMELYSVIAEEEIVEMKTSANYIALSSADGTLVVLDKFANYYTKTHMEDNALFDLDNNKLYYLESGLLFIVDLNTRLSMEVKIDVSDIKDINVSGNMIFILAENSLITFQILY